MLKKSRKIDYILLIIVLVLLVVGLVIMYSASAYNGWNTFGDSYYYLKKQFFATSLGLALMYITANIDYHVWERFAVLGYIVAILLSIAVIFLLPDAVILSPSIIIFSDIGARHKLFASTQNFGMIQ